MDFAFRMAEERIKQADKNGEFKDLPGKGKPLDLSEINAVPEDLRMGYTVLKNANNHFDKRRFPSPRWTEQTKDLPFSY